MRVHSMKKCIIFFTIVLGSASSADRFSELIQKLEAYIANPQAELPPEEPIIRSIPEVDFADTLQADLDETDALAASAVKKILIHPSINLITDESKIIIESIKGGANTCSIFKVSNAQTKQPLYIIKTLKESASINETREYKQLHVVQRKPYSNPQLYLKSTTDPFLQTLLPSIDKLPRVCLVKFILFYEDTNKQIHIAEIIDAAEGAAIGTYLNDNEISIEDFGSICRVVGNSLGLFHLLFIPKQERNATLMRQKPEQWRGTMHGDFHLYNVFCTFKPEVFFIDNEGMRRQKILKDLLGFIARLQQHLTTLESYQEQKALNGIVNLIEGYVENFPADRYEDLVEACYFRILELCDPKTTSLSRELLSTDQLHALIHKLRSEITESNEYNPVRFFIEKVESLIGYPLRNFQQQPQHLYYPATPKKFARPKLPYSLRQQK